MSENEFKNSFPKPHEKIDMEVELEKLLNRELTEESVVKRVTVKSPNNRKNIILYNIFMIIVTLVVMGIFYGPAFYFGIRFLIDDFPVIGWILVVIGSVIFIGALYIIATSFLRKDKDKRVKPIKTYARRDDPLADKIQEEMTPENIQRYMNLTPAEINGMSDPIELHLIARILLAFHGAKWANPGAFMQFLRIENELPVAIMCLEKVLQMNSENYHAWNNIGYAHMELMDFDVAIEKYNKSVEINPNYDVPWFNLGIAYGRKNQHEKTFDYVWKALQINPHSANYWTSLGLRFFMKKEYDFAIKCYKRAIELEPDQENYKKDLGEIQYKIQKRKRKEEKDKK